MINRQNYHDIKSYLDYMENIQQAEKSTLKRAWSHLRHLLEWADEKPFPRSPSITPTFPTYLVNYVSNGKKLAPSTIVKCLTQARQFYAYAKTAWQSRYKTISDTWIASLKPNRKIRSNSGMRNHKFYTLDQVMKIVEYDTDNLHLKRAKVAVAMLFCSGMRADALASLPIICVDLENNCVLQFPEMGVRTKNYKSGITYLLPIDPLLELIHKWDEMVRSFPEYCLWYSPISRDNSRLIPTTIAYYGRNSTVQKDVRMICQAAGVAYLSPHKLRHGHVMYAIQHAKTIKDLKAISANVMHSSLIVTDQIYGVLQDIDVKNFITSLEK